MDLADQLNQLADDVAPRQLPDADSIRRRGDTLRLRRRAHLALAATVATIVSVVTVAIAINSLSRPTPEPVGPERWQVTRTLVVPGSGVAVYADGSLWVVDTKDGALAQDGTTPAGGLYEIDPGSGRILDQIPGAVGGWPNVDAGSVWLCTAAGGLNVLTRVDLATRRITRIDTSTPELPHGTTVASGNLWVAQWASGDLLRLDLRTNRVLETIHLGDVATGRAPQSVIGDGRSIWVANDNGLVIHLDGATGHETSRVQLPARELRFDGLDTQRHVLYAHSVRGNSIFEITIDQAGSDHLGRELLLGTTTDGMLAGFASSSDSLWVATMNPDQLLRINPTTFTIVQRLPLAHLDRNSNVPVALAARDRTVWVRVQGKVLELTPQR